jgi:exoribonuclease-2
MNYLLVGEQATTSYIVFMTSACCVCSCVWLQEVLASQVQDDSAATRIDLTHQRCYTIDDESTTEVDDGVTVTTVDGQGKPAVCWGKG